MVCYFVLWKKKGQLGLLIRWFSFASLLKSDQDSMIIWGGDLLGEQSMDFYNRWSGAWLPSNPKLSLKKFQKLLMHTNWLLNFDIPILLPQPHKKINRWSKNINHWSFGLEFWREFTLVRCFLGTCIYRQGTFYNSCT